MQSQKRALLSLVISTAILLPGLAARAATDPTVIDLGFTSHSGSYLVGRAAGRQRDFEIAAMFFNRVYEENPLSFELMQRAFALSVSTGDMDRAVELAQKVIERKSSNQLARLVLGLQDAKVGRFKQARKHFKAAEKDRIGQLTSAVLVAWTYAGEGKKAKAYAQLDNLGGQGRFVALHRAYIADFLGDKKAAEKAFDSAYAPTGNSRRLVNSFGTFLWRNGQPGRARVIFANYLHRVERNPLIVDKLTRLNNGEKAPQMITKVSDGMFEVLFSLAAALSDKRNANVALIYAQLGVFMRPQLPESRILLAEIFEGMKKYQKAIDIYRTVNQPTPLRSNMEIQIANDLDNLGKTKEALEVLDGLIARKPNFYQAWSTKGSILYSAKRWSEAAEALSLTLARVKEKERKHWVIYYYRGMAYERAGHWEKAEPDFLMALKLRPAHPSVLNYLGYSWIDRGLHLDEAVKMVEKAAELRPRDGYIIDSVGWAYYRLGRYKLAVNRLERAVKLKPGDPTINDHLGDAYWRVDRKLEAKFQWAHARDNKPEKKDLQKILKKLKEGLPDKPAVQ